MRVHLVGGFLGSGKTTAIIAAAKQLIAKGQRVGIVTNDQGKYLVDTGFFQLADLPTVEVSGGCFCCNFDDLDARLEQLAASSKPDVIFAESVGSCADLVATVIKPLLELRMLEFTPASLSVFTDSRLLRLRLLDEPMPFNEDVCYIFDKQIEEAGLLVVNKIDLLTSQRFEDLNLMVAQRYPAKPILFQNSLAHSQRRKLAAASLRRGAGVHSDPLAGYRLPALRRRRGSPGMARPDPDHRPARRVRRASGAAAADRTIPDSHPGLSGSHRARQVPGAFQRRGKLQTEFYHPGRKRLAGAHPRPAGKPAQPAGERAGRDRCRSIAHSLRGCAAAQRVGFPPAKQPVFPPRPAQTHPPLFINKKR